MGVGPPSARPHDRAGGGLSLDGERWVACRPRLFLPTGALAPIPQLEKLDPAHRAGQLQFFGKHAALTKRKPSQPIWRRCVGVSGWSTVNAYSGNPQRSYAISPAVPIAPPTRAWSRSMTKASPSNGRITASKVGSDTG